MQIKPYTVSQYFSKSSPGFLFSSSHNGNLPTATCPSFSSSFHPATNRCHCPPTLLRNTVHLAFAYRAIKLASPSSKSLSVLLQRNRWLRDDYMDLLGNFFACTNKGCKHTKTWLTTTTPSKCHLPFRLLADVLFQILRQLYKLLLPSPTQLVPLPAQAAHLWL